MATSVDLPTNLGLRIKAVRQYYSERQAEFAERIGVSRSYLSEVENGKSKPSIEMIVGIAKKCPEVRHEWLLTGLGEMSPDQETPTTPKPTTNIDVEGIKAALTAMDAIEKARDENDKHSLTDDERAAFICYAYDTYESILQEVTRLVDEYAAHPIAKEQFNIALARSSALSLGGDAGEPSVVVRRPTPKKGR